MKNFVAVVLFSALLCLVTPSKATSQPAAQSTEEHKAAVRIPDDVMKAKFGKEHTFLLTVRGPNPVFTQAGYSFLVSTDVHVGSTGATKIIQLTLYVPAYYDVPVYIAVDEAFGTKEYRLYSTDEDHDSIDIVLLGKAKD